MFNFDNTFELHQDVDILKRMGLDCGLHSGACTSESLTQAKSLLPKMLGPVLDGEWINIVILELFVLVKFSSCCRGRYCIDLCTFTEIKWTKNEKVFMDILQIEISRFTVVSH